MGERTITKYKLSHRGQTLYADFINVIVRNMATNYIASDAMGNFYYTDEENNQVYRIDSSDAGKVVEVTEPQIIYNGADHDEISSPGAIGADSLYIYIANQVDGLGKGKYYYIL